MKTYLNPALFCIFFGQILACSGTSPKGHQQPAPQNTEAQDGAAALDDSLPEATIVRVKLDEYGKVVEGSENMRLVQATSVSSTPATEFEAAVSTPQAARADELDQTSSTQTWTMTNFDQAGQNSEEQGGQDQNSQYQGGDDQDRRNGQRPGDQTYPNQTYPNQTYPNQTYPDQGQEQCGRCPQSSQSTACPPCGDQIEHRQGAYQTSYPVERRTVYEHRTTDVYPQRYVDVYPVETIRIHPTNTVTRVHPLTQQIQYVGNHCERQSVCGYGAQYYPTVNYNSYNQYYHYQSYSDFGGNRYYRYYRPRVFGRFGL
ncbi:MAG: hypothetical protein NTV34_12310, partial [Proteobacteria bacterium]|nr:hypothetical protein [Pseudomonadota bacterium]